MSAAGAPNPGSVEAVQQGCVCPVLDNGHGRGYGRDPESGELLFVLSMNCPIHNPLELAEDD